MNPLKHENNEEDVSQGTENYHQSVPDCGVVFVEVEVALVVLLEYILYAFDMR